MRSEPRADERQVATMTAPVSIPAKESTLLAYSLRSYRNVNLSYTNYSHPSSYR